jgi:signal peptidase II
VLLKLLAAAGVLFFLDQFTKQLVSRHLAEGQALTVGSWLRIRRVTNVHGVVLARHLRLLVLAWAGLLGGCCLIIRQGFFLQTGAAQLALGLALGGAGSNLYDQLRRGAVLDFIDLGWWPVFNFADAAITLGVILILWSIF